MSVKRRTLKGSWGLLPKRLKEQELSEVNRREGYWREWFWPAKLAKRKSVRTVSCCKLCRELWGCSILGSPNHVGGRLPNGADVFVSNSSPQIPWVTPVKNTRSTTVWLFLWSILGSFSGKRCVLCLPRKSLSHHPFNTQNTEGWQFENLAVRGVIADI